MWLPARLLDAGRQASLVEALVAAAVHWGVTLHFNKGMAGGAPEAIAACRETATNPQVLDAFALVICAADAPPAWPGIPGHEPNLAEAKTEASHVQQAMAPLRRLVPAAGTYMSEANYHDTDWQAAYWGEHHARLAAIKRRYDPDHVFRGHHVVGGT